jgi:pimeloyl-ACP methyl ester carboxylesterase
VTDGLVLLHAFPLDARMWEAQLSAFSGVLPVIAPHLPGFGGTEPAGEVMTMGAAADRVLAELDRADVDRAAVCGLSMGGYVTFELWRRAPHRIAGLVLANTRAEPDSEEGAATRRALAERLRREGNGFLVETPPPLLSQGAPEELRAYVRRLIADQPADAIAAASLGMAERPDSRPDLPGIDVPALVITSTEDTLIPSSMSMPMADAIPGATLLVMEGAGHLSNLEQADAFSGALEEHVERAGLRG